MATEEKQNLSKIKPRINRNVEELKLCTPQAVLDRGKQIKNLAKSKFKQRIFKECKDQLSVATDIPVFVSICMSEDNCVSETSQSVLKILTKEFISIPWEISISAAHETRDGYKTVRFDYLRNTNTNTK